MFGKKPQPARVHNPRADPIGYWNRDDTLKILSSEIITLLGEDDWWSGEAMIKSTYTLYRAGYEITHKIFPDLVKEDVRHTSRNLEELRELIKC